MWVLVPFQTHHMVIVQHLQVNPNALNLFFGCLNFVEPTQRKKKKRRVQKCRHFSVLPSMIIILRSA